MNATSLHAELPAAEAAVVSLRFLRPIKVARLFVMLP